MQYIKVKKSSQSGEKDKYQDAKKLREFVYSLPMSEFLPMRRKLAKACFVSDGTFKNWLGGRCRIPELAKIEMEKVARVKIFD